VSDDPEDLPSESDDNHAGFAPLSAAELSALVAGRMAAGPAEIRRLVEEVQELRNLLAATFEYAEAIDETRTNAFGSKKPSVSLLIEEVRRALWKRGFLGGPNPGRGS
jgi:hypothetical protein